MLLSIVLALSLACAVVGPVVLPRQQLLVIDSDPGIDDAVALLMALGDPAFKVLAITCVRGNTAVTNATDNVLKLLSVARRFEVPVYRGQNNGLVERVNYDGFFGKDGFGDLSLPRPSTGVGVQGELAASFLSRVVREYPGEVTVLALGPLTNLALAIHLNPNFLRQARRVVILGGTVRGLGNVAPGLEFNFYLDPDAATFVLERALSSGVHLTLIPLETCEENDLGQDWRWNILAKIDNPVVSFLNKLEQKQLQKHPSNKYHPADIFAAAVALSPRSVVRSQGLYGFVENRSRKTQGALVVDYTNKTTNPINLDVVMDIDKKVIKKIVFDNLSNFHTHTCKVAPLYHNL